MPITIIEQLEKSPLGSSMELLDPLWHSIGPGLQLYLTSAHPLSNKGEYNSSLDSLRT